MKKMIIGLVVLVASVASAQSFVISHESLTIANTAVGISAAVHTVSDQKVSKCVGRLETAQVRYWSDGTAPTASVGILLEVGDVITLNNWATIKNFRAIRTGAVSGVLSVECAK